MAEPRIPMPQALYDEFGKEVTDKVQDFVRQHVLAERERCTRIADDEARIREEAGQKHVVGSMARDRCFAGARAAANVAKGIRIGEGVPAVTQVVLPHHIGTIFSDGYWNLNVDLRDPREVEPAWGNRGKADVYTADQVRQILRARGVLAVDPWRELPTVVFPAKLVGEEAAGAYYRAEDVRRMFADGVTPTGGNDGR